MHSSGFNYNICVLFLKKLTLYCIEIFNFPSNSAITLTSFFLEFWNMQLREENCHTMCCLLLEGH